MTARNALSANPPRRRGRPPTLKVRWEEPSDTSVTKYSLNTNCSDTDKRSPKNKGKAKASTKRASKRILAFKEDSEGEMVKSKKFCQRDPNSYEPAPLTGELPPPVRRASPITYEEASKGTFRPVRVYADGVFDVFHSGHARVLMQAKNAFPNTHLIAGVTSDEMTQKLKGKTVCTESERYDALRHCRYVDEVLTDAPWVITPEFMEKHQIDFVVHDDVPYGSGNTEDIYKPIKDMGRFVASQRTPGISTSDIIARIVKDYDIYLKRNFERGYTAKDLNVGFIKAHEVKLRETMSNFKHGMESKIGGFLSLFGRDGRISEFFHDQKEKLKRVFSPEHSSPEAMAVDGGEGTSGTSAAAAAAAAAEEDNASEESPGPLSSPPLLGLEDLYEATV